MNDELSSWQTRLERHFAELCKQRRASKPGHPVFALEHGLSAAELKTLGVGLRAHVAAQAPSRDHALTWIVYASEIGYDYAGDEYWQTFERVTPGWGEHGDRYWIRDSFLSFQKRFGGAIPGGAWAKNFSIICWPITHAILPLDLQRQLARVLYELRHVFSAELFDSPVTLGEFIAARSWNATSRFQNLVQDTQLVGQIAAALLLEGEFGTGSLIHGETLKRISGDLERERQARDWLKSARRFAQEGTKVRGLAFGGHRIFAAGRLDEARAEAVALGIEPRLVLRPNDIERTSWQVLLEVPDLSHLSVKFPKAREVLAGSRCVVAGASGGPLARGRLLHGTQRVRLSRWPATDEVLLKFEQSDAHLEYLLRTECLLRPGDLWLFRIASDGLAYESRSLGVRPGQNYIIASACGAIDGGDHVRPVDLGCAGIHGALLELPGALTDEWECMLRQFGLGQAKTIEVWPAGLGAVVWDGEGHGEWLASERPCLGIRTDHRVHALLVSVEDAGEESLELTPIEPGDAVFVELPQLPVGVHAVRVSSRSNATDTMNPLGDLDVVMRVREARPWSHGVSARGPLNVQVEPPSPSMEQVWEGRAQVSLQGPAGRHVRCRISFYDSDPDHALFARSLPRLPFPVTAEQWREHFESHVGKQRNAENAYDIARTCEIAFRAEELGAFTLRCEREFTPLRWTLRHTGGAYVLRLHDDSGEETRPRIQRLAYDTPCTEEPLGSASEYSVPEDGGMYVARTAQCTSAILVPPTNVGLDNLRCVPRLAARTRSLGSVMHVLSQITTWANAKLPGNILAKQRRSEVLCALTKDVFGLIGGSNWAAAERCVPPTGTDVSSLADAISRRREEAAIGVLLARESAALAETGISERIARLGELGQKFLTIRCEREACWHAELALRLASSPMDVSGWVGDRLADGLTYLMEQPTLARAARYMVLAVDRHHESRTSGTGLYAGWNWS